MISLGDFFYSCASYVLQIWDSVWCSSIGTRVPVYREMLVDSLLWTVYKTSTFKLPLQDLSNHDAHCISIESVRIAVKNDFNAQLLGDSMIAALLLLCLSHGMQVGAIHGDLESTYTNCGACQDVYSLSIKAEELTEDDMKVYPLLIDFIDRGFNCSHNLDFLEK